MKANITITKYCLSRLVISLLYQLLVPLFDQLANVLGWVKYQDNNDSWLIFIIYSLNHPHFTISQTSVILNNFLIHSFVYYRIMVWYTTYNKFLTRWIANLYHIGPILFVFGSYCGLDKIQHRLFHKSNDIGLTHPIYIRHFYTVLQGKPKLQIPVQP